MATLKSKLKEQLQKEKDLAIDEIVDNEYDSLVGRKWLESINRIIKVCEDRKRY